jgi:T5SS/PEP-CTERM-associated repeat protein
MIKQVVVVVMSFGLCVSAARGDIAGSGDMTPPDPSTWTKSTDAYVGLRGGATLDINNGGMLDSYDVHVGYFPGSTGVVTVDGSGSAWVNPNNFRVGWEGVGAVAITDGGSVTSGQSIIGGRAGSRGSVTISGSGSNCTNAGLAYVGILGVGELSILDGGSMNSTETYIASKDGSTGVVTVSGAGSTWTIAGVYPYIRVGEGGRGRLDISHGGSVSNVESSIGYYAGSDGTVTVSGADSKWAMGYLYVGYLGRGVLDISDGGMVEVRGRTRVEAGAGSSGGIIFDNGTLTTGGLRCPGTSLVGTGTINAHGLVSDVDLVFDATHGLSQTLTLSGPGQDITVNLDVDGSASMGVGYSGKGSMLISDGVDIQSAYGYLGYQPGSTGVVTIKGAGSTWTDPEALYVGFEGSGTLEIIDGGVLSTRNSQLGLYSGSMGVVTVSGIGSRWSSGGIEIGVAGDGTMNIINGGLVKTSRRLTIDGKGNGGSFVNMATGGKLALPRDCDDSLESFLQLVGGSGAIRYWDASISDWADITGALSGLDYTLAYRSEGALAGYTVLTVPEPATLLVLAAGGLPLLLRRRRNRR